MVDFAIKAFRLVRGALGRAIDRLRQPGGVLRATCAVLAALSLAGGIHIYGQQAEIFELRISSLRCEAEIEGARGKVQGWEAAVSQLRDTLIADALERERQLERSRQALASAQQQREEAEERARDFQERYGERAPQCRAAVELLDEHCVDLRGY